MNLGSTYEQSHCKQGPTRPDVREMKQRRERTIIIRQLTHPVQLSSKVGILELAEQARMAFELAAIVESFDDKEPSCNEPCGAALATLADSYRICITR